MNESSQIYLDVKSQDIYPLWNKVLTAIPSIPGDIFTHYAKVSQIIKGFFNCHKQETTVKNRKRLFCIKIPYTQRSYT